MLFKKKTPPIENPPIEYTASLDSERKLCPIFINLSTLKQILSIERCEINTPDEHTKVFCEPEEGKVDDYQFDISRKQHAELIEQAAKLKEKQ